MPFRARHARLGAARGDGDRGGFLPEAIGAARALAAETGISASFVQSELLELPEKLEGEFDIVFTSHGALPWLPDLAGWARVAAHFLRPGGSLCVIDGHPLANSLDESRGDGDLRIAYPYFESPEPLRFEQSGSYAVPDAALPTVTYEWPHSLSELFGAVLGAGLAIESFQEYPYEAWRALPWMVQRPDGMWELPGGDRRFPFMFSLRATRPAA